MLKAQGLQTRQRVQSGAADSVPSFAAWHDFYLGDPTDLNALGVTVNGADDKIDVRQMHLGVTVTNATNAPAYFRCYWLKCRKTYTGTIRSLAQDQAPTVDVSYIDPTTSTAFRRYWKILRTKRRYVKGGEAFHAKIHKFFRSGSTVSGDYEGNVTSFSVTPFTYLLWIFMDTIPLEGESVGDNVNTGDAKFNWITHHKYTYYLPEDNDPSSTLLENLPEPDVGGYQIMTDLELQQERVDQP